MPQSVAEFMDNALELPEQQRAELANLLLASLASPPSALHPAWASELRRRTDQIDAGIVEAIPWDEVRRQADSQLSRDEQLNG